jgi:hypothetical protein
MPLSNSRIRQFDDRAAMKAGFWWRITGTLNALVMWLAGILAGAIRADLLHGSPVDHPKVRARFRQRLEQADATKAAFNQGFYNLFCRVFAGLALALAGCAVSGLTLATWSLSMLCGNCFGSLGPADATWCSYSRAARCFFYCLRSFTGTPDADSAHGMRISKLSSSSLYFRRSLPASP